MDYADVSFRFESRQEGEIPVQISTPAGEGRGRLRPPFAGTDFGALLSQLGRAVHGGASEVEADSRQVRPPEPHDTPSADPQAVGEELFRSLFTEPALALFQGSLQRLEGAEGAEPEGKVERGLRLVLHLDPAGPDFAFLAGLPWELLYWPENRQFLGLSRRTAIVRYLNLPRATPPQRIETALRILAVGAFPAGLPVLDLTAERQKIEKSWAKLPGVEVEFLDSATAGDLRVKLGERLFHVLHFMGHGAFSERGEGGLAFVGENGGLNLVPGQALADLLRDSTTLRLVVLNACNTARSARRGGLDPFAGVAAALALAGPLAIVAMQFPISDAAAIAFSRAFYAHLAAGDPVEAATVEGRQAIRAADARSWEWVTPALFLRGGGQLFEIPGGPLRHPTAELARHLLDQGTYIADKTAGFVGRGWVFDAVDQFTHDATRGYFLLRGDPGIGKTTFLAEMVKRESHPHHFNLRAGGIQRADVFLGNLCAQLITRYGLDYGALPAAATQDGRFLAGLLDKVSGKLPHGEKAVLVIDALDETDSAGLIPGANVLYLPPLLPQGIYVVATTRRGPLTLRIDCEQRVLDLEQDSGANLADVRELVEAALAREGIRTYRIAQGLDEAAFVDEMVDKSQGNFMYLRHVLPEIEHGAYQDRSFASLPAGLQSYYEDHWKRMRAADESAWLQFQLPVLVMLTAVKEPVSVDLIAEFSGISDTRRIRSVLAAWDGFLYTAGTAQPKRYRLYHASFHDFIAAKDEVAGEHVSLRSAHERIADFLVRDLEKEL
ncbi:MAG TPA: CHAT domain-containing protein [Thermoanaerobaculia bacterium]|nr:CHAT domain-containing protein [Thermoanaerobaculia bacterium]